MANDGPDAPTPDGEADGPQDIDRIRAGHLSGIRPRLGVSVPGAIGGVLLITALAFGSNLPVPRFERDPGADAGGSDTALVETEPTDTSEGGPAGDEPTAEPTENEPEPTKATEPGDEAGAEEPTGEPGADATEPEAEATPKPTARPEPEATPKPTDRPEPKATPKPTPKPEPTARPVLSLSLSIRDGQVFIDWGACEVTGADAYKVVRSTDPTVKWPAGDGDQLIAVIEIGGSTKAWDEHAPAGKTAWYRVFCVRHTDTGYKVLAASATKSIVAPKEPEATPKPTPTPEPSAMWIEAGAEGGHVTLDWEACGGDTFSHYRLLRRTDGGDAQVIAEIENASTTTYVDDGLEPGTYQYAVQCKGHVGDDWILLGSTGWATVTVE